MPATSNLDAAYDLIHIMHIENAEHVTKHYRLREMPQSKILQQAASEMIELAAEHDPVRVLDELGDVFACLIHFAITYGFSFDVIGMAIIKKMAARFDWPSKK